MKAKVVDDSSKNGVQQAVKAAPIAREKELVSSQVFDYMNKEKIDAWISYQFSDKVKNEPMTNVFKIPNGLTTAIVSVLFADDRAPLLFVAKMESTKFEYFKEYGELITYVDQKDFVALFKEKVAGCKKIAMEYAAEEILAPGVPATLKGFVQRAAKAKVVSSIGVIQNAVVPVSEEALAEHRLAAVRLQGIIDDCFAMIRAGIYQKPVTEYEVQQFILSRYKALGMATCHNAPIVAVNGHIADVHYEAKEKGSAEIKKGDVVLIDVWAKNDRPNAAYADMTQMCFVGERKDIPENYAKAFKVQVHATERALAYIEEKIKQGKPIIPWKVDMNARSWITQHGYPEFPHSTGHNMVTQDVHGPGIRLGKLMGYPLTLNSLYTIEPGIYVPEGKPPFGARTEFDIYLSQKGVVVTTPVQKEIACLV